MVISKVIENQPMSRKCRFRTASSQKSTTGAFIEEIRFWKQNILTKSCVYSIIFLRKLNQEIFRATTKSHNHSGGDKERHIRGNFTVFEGHFKLSHAAKGIGKNCSTSKSILARPPICDRAYPDKPMTVPPRNSVGFTKVVRFYCLQNRTENLRKSRQVLGKPIFETFQQ